MFTYRNLALNQFSCIDHFLIDTTLLCDILSGDIVDSGANLSDHIPVIIKLSAASITEVHAASPRRPAPKCTKCGIHTPWAVQG